MVRRTIDILFALFWLIPTSPLLIVLAVLIKRSSPGSVFYAPEVVGQHGRVFRLYRFRTMTNDTTRCDPEQRLTGIGRFMREYSLDHFVQPINLLLGDLTLVGPRPMERAVVDLQDPVWQRYCQVKPGLINFAVLTLGREWTPSRRAAPHLNQELELHYLDRRSARRDAQLVFRSLWSLLISRGNPKMRGRPDDKVLRRPR